MHIKYKRLIYISLLIALEIVLSRFLSIATPIMKIGFGFVPIAICAMMFGPVWAGFAGALADILGAVLFPIGAPFLGFTLSAGLTGMVFGLFLYNKEEGVGWAQLAAAVALNCLVISLLLNTYWLTILWGQSFVVLLPTRIIQNLIMIPVQFMVLRVLQGPVEAYIKRIAW